ncbi:ferredoxin [Saccharothrix syringae]|uniref:Ferredoxin n=1 Tax=Saccharothrix syringae TaxID=103733 RepID=A0A5Q0GXU5_SACSY|nr:ferredoxin [Saccharothrix syringae]QFZ18769.1 ferredoxin [Saccharothrix syringae]
MRILVDRVRCQNHGQCAISAPTNFELDADGELRYRESFDDEDASDIEDAVDSCPVQAITLDSDG